MDENKNNGFEPENTNQQGTPEQGPQEQPPRASANWEPQPDWQAQPNWGAQPNWESQPAQEKPVQQPRANGWVESWQSAPQQPPATPAPPVQEAPPVQQESFPEQPWQGVPMQETQPVQEPAPMQEADAYRQVQSQLSRPSEPQHQINQPIYERPQAPSASAPQQVYTTQGIYGGQKAPKQRRQRRWVKPFFKTVGMLVLVAAVSVGSTIGYLSWYGPSNTSGGNGGNQAGGTKVVYQPTYSEDSLTTSQIYADNVSSVVAITSQLPNGSGVGTGIIMKENGYIITNDHVVADAVKITVRTYDGKEYEAKIVGTDEKTDIAVIKIEANGLKAATFGDSDELVVGEPAMVIGNPLGLEFANTTTQGIVSYTSRDIQIGSYIMNVIQTDASINPGNSGGPMFNSRGEVIGVVSAKIKTSEAEGIGFAIPSNLAMKIANDFIEYGSVQNRPMLGVTVEEINAYYAQMQGVETGVRIAEVVRGGAAEQAGIQVGDYITQFNGVEVSSISELNYAKDKCKVGDTVKVELQRQGQKVVVDLVLKDANQLAS